MASEEQLHPLLYAVEIGGVTHPVNHVTGHEALSRPHRFELVLYVHPDDPLDPDAIIGGDAFLVLTREAPLRRVHCVVTSASRAATRKGNAGAGKVKLVLESRLAITRFRVDIRIFRDKTAPEIVTEVLEAHGLTVESRLAGSYVRRPYCVQMRESDHDFAARLLEDEGIFHVVDERGPRGAGRLRLGLPGGPGPPVVRARHRDARAEGRRLPCGLGGPRHAGQGVAARLQPREAEPRHGRQRQGADRVGPRVVRLPGRVRGARARPMQGQPPRRGAHLREAAPGRAVHVRATWRRAPSSRSTTRPPASTTASTW